MALMTDQDLEQVVGELLSDMGNSRDVYEHLNNPNLVIKKWKNYSENCLGCSSTNWLEWQIWCNVKDTEYGKHFAKCHQISQSGLYLVMERLDVCTLKDQQQVDAIDWPVFLNDVLAFNFGRDKNGVIKCLDYSSTRDGYFLNLARKSTLLGNDPFNQN